MEYTIDELRNKLFKDVLDVYDVFINHFGEQYTDLQDLPSTESLQDYIGPSITPSKEGKYEISEAALHCIKAHYDHYYNIYVWWPKVTITNENSRSVNIQDLYAKITINLKGFIPLEQHGFLLNRATYSSIQFNSDYMHSHIHNIPIDDFTEFKQPCLGKGPIVYTINSLKVDPDEALWMLFCEELSRYVTVESLTGVPYKHLEQIGNIIPLSYYDRFYPAPHDTADTLHSYCFRHHTASPYYLNKNLIRGILKDFLSYYLQHGHFIFSFKNRAFTCGMSYYDYMIDVSNCFIQYYNENLKESPSKISFLYDQSLILKALVINRKFNGLSRRYRDASNINTYQGRQVLRFKDKDIKLRIFQEEDSPVQETTIINWQIAMYVLDSILKIINFRYQNEYNRALSIISGDQELAQAHKTVCYI